MHGIPMFYAGPKTDLQISWDRRLADARKPGWRTYLLKKAQSIHRGQWLQLRLPQSQAEC
jgi:hypothetical protein